MKRTLLSTICLAAACMSPIDKGFELDDTAVENEDSDMTPGSVEEQLPLEPAEDTEEELHDTGDDWTDDSDEEESTDPTQVVDIVYGAQVERDGSYWVEDGLLHHGSEEIQLRGISWFGFDTTDHALHGLWTGQTTTDLLDQVESLGFNALRIPVAPESLREDTALPSWPGVEGMTTSRELLEYLLEEADQRDL